jgi:hypothetical protein
MSDSQAATTQAQGPQIAYQYFWVKIATKYEVNRQRTEGLTGKDDAYLQPQTVSVHPTPLRKAMIMSDRKLSVDIGVRIDMTEVEKHDKYIDVRILDGYNRQQAEQWIGTDEGKRWAGHAFCFLCHASVEFH